MLKSQAAKVITASLLALSTSAALPFTASAGKDNFRIQNDNRTEIMDMSHLSSSQIATVLQRGTVVSFSVSRGYPQTTESYCGVVTYWNGASYDIRANGKMFYRVPEESVVVGC